jgi:sodium-dependent dicarboxylate transporter 2/3/5
LLYAASLGLQLPPLLIILPATFAASCAFMLPVATPPNAIVFGSGYLRIAQMSRAGFWLNIAAIALITVAAYAILIPLLGVAL